MEIIKGYDPQTRHFTHALQSSMLNILCSVPYSLSLLFILLSPFHHYLPLHHLPLAHFPNLFLRLFSLTPILLSFLHEWHKSFSLWFTFFFFTTPPLFLPSPHLIHMLTLPLPPQILLHPYDNRITFKDATI